ncbi:MAG: ATP-binding cassette domain-containing protein, partial [Thermofilaceae archaeon]
MPLAIEAVNLTKVFGSFKAVDNITLKVEEGVIFGLLGPNGAGKSTTIRMILGLLKPTSGYIRVFGIDVEK